MTSIPPRPIIRHQEETNKMKTITRTLQLALSTMLLLFAATSGAADCSACKSYPGLCGKIDTCVKECNVSPFQAKNCYKAGKITKDHCDKLYNKCEDPCEDCQGFPTMCGKAEFCIKNCNVSSFQAQNCFQAGKMSEATCKSLYPGCKPADPKCNECRSYPGLCGSIDKCVKECNVSPFQAQNCMKAGKIDLGKCKSLYPECKQQ